MIFVIATSYELFLGIVIGASVILIFRIKKIYIYRRAPLTIICSLHPPPKKKEKRKKEMSALNTTALIFYRSALANSSFGFFSRPFTVG